MDIYSIAYGPLLWASFLIFIAGMTARTALFLRAIITTRPVDDQGIRWVINRISRSLLPYHRAVLKRPIFLSVRYIFHLMLFVIPIWYSGHIMMWESSRFELNWNPLPDTWVHNLTILIVIFCAFFLIRRILLACLRKKFSYSNFLIIFITVLPFVTGYASYHSHLTSIPFLSDNMLLFHILSGELMLIIIPFLFLKVVFDDSKCTGCTACTTVCPTGTLSFQDINDIRRVSYQHFQCISCGTCVRYCPDSAPSLQHELSAGRLFQVKKRTALFTTKLFACDICGTRFAPEKQIERASNALANDKIVYLCPRCRAIQANTSSFTFRPLFSRKPADSFNESSMENQRGKDKQYVRSALGL